MENADVREKGECWKLVRRENVGSEGRGRSKGAGRLLEVMGEGECWK